MPPRDTVSMTHVDSERIGNCVYQTCPEPPAFYVKTFGEWEAMCTRHTREAGGNVNAQ